LKKVVEGETLKASKVLSPAAERGNRRCIATASEDVRGYPFWHQCLHLFCDPQPQPGFAEAII
jgi:hypothetical protein